MDDQRQYRYRFTVFTPTFNRADTLPHVYESLKEQTFRDFEWLVVDDGSIDETQQIVNAWIQESKFPIRYFYQKNRGKHVAINSAIREAQGELFLIADSDDRFVSDALEQFTLAWDSIPKEKKDSFSGVIALCQDKNMNLIGNRFPQNRLDSDSITMSFWDRVTGDKWRAYRTEIMQRFPFPEITGEKFIAEGLIWNRIARQYKQRFINMALNICEYRKDGLSASSLHNRCASPRGARLYYQEALALRIPYDIKLKVGLNYIRFSFHGKTPIIKIITDVHCRVLICILLIVGYAQYCIDLFRVKYQIK